MGAESTLTSPFPFINIEHFSVAKAGLDFTSHLELTVDTAALHPEFETVTLGVLCHALSGYGFRRDNFQTDCEAHLYPGEMSSVTHSESPV